MGNCEHGMCAQLACKASLGRCVDHVIAISSVSLQEQPGQHATAHITQHPEEQQPAATDSAIAKLGSPAKQLAVHAEVQSLAQALREAEQRASAAELAVATVQRTHTEAVEQSARLQVGHAVMLVKALQLIAEQGVSRAGPCLSRAPLAAAALVASTRLSWAF